MNSMIYYVIHWIILDICSLILVSGFHLHGYVFFILMIVVCLSIPTLII